MRQQSSPRARNQATAAADLSEYGDLSALESKLSRGSAEDDDRAAIDLIMRGEAFRVGDGTLESPLRNEDRDLDPPPPSGGRMYRTEKSHSEPSAISGLADSGGQVARTAVADALARLESLAGASRDADDRSLEAQHEESGVAPPDDGAGDTFVGVGGELDGDAPSPFVLPKLPGSYATSHFAAPGDPQPAHAEQTRRHVADTPQIASPALAARLDRRRAISEDGNAPNPGPGSREPIAASGAEDFAPFDLRGSEDPKDAETFDSRSAEIPPYARTRETTTSGIPSDHELADFLPPQAGETSAAVRPVSPERERASRYSEPRDGLERGDPHDAPEERQADTDVDALTAPESLDPPEPADAVAAEGATKHRSLFAQSRNILLVVAFALVLIGVKSYTRAPAREPAAPASTSVEAASESPERKISRAPIQQPISALLPSASETTVKAPPVAGQDKTVTARAPSDANSVAGAPVPDQGLRSQLAALSQRVNALENERNQLRDENAALRRKPAVAKGPKAVAESHPTAKASVESPRPRLPTIQYLGTFRDADRLVAEVLLDGSLNRVKRGDVLGAHRVDAVGEMSVTINGTTYAP